MCIKASRVGEKRYIEHEVRALLALQSDSSRCNYISRLEQMGKLVYNIRSTKVAVPAIVISPLGSPISDVNIEQDKKETAKSLLRDITAALEFAHQKSVFHLDVRLDNIVFDKSKKVFVLIDWTSAACGNEQVVGFRGALPFAHAEVHGKENTQRWHPEAKHDLASLGFSIAAYMSDQSVPWHGFYKRIHDKDDYPLFEERRKAAVALLELFEERRKPAGASLEKAGTSSDVKAWEYIEGA